MVSHQPDKFGGHGHCGTGDILFSVCHVFLQDRYVTLLVRVPQSESPFFQFGSHRHSGSGDIIDLVCHVTSQDHGIKALYDFIIRSRSR